MTTIEWTQRPGTKGETWNPFAAFDKETGKRGWMCQKVSPGCTHCYAETFNNFRGNGHPYRVGELEKVDIRLVNIDQPLRWRQPRMVFVCSMTDLFFEGHSDDDIAAVFGVMAMSPDHTFQVLTKRPERMREVVGSLSVADAIAAAGVSFVDHSDHERLYGRLNRHLHEYDHRLPFPNIWLGTSVEDQQRADERIPFLLDTPAAVRFLSCEPLIGPIDLEQYLIPAMRVSRAPSDVPPSRRRELSAEDMHMLSRLGRAAMRQYGDQEFVDWVIVGGESGPGARPCDVAHIRSLVGQCQAAGVPVFVKQLGAEPGFRLEDEECRGNAMPGYHHYDKDWGLYIKRLSDRKGGDIAEWPEDLRVREWPAMEAHV